MIPYKEFSISKYWTPFEKSFLLVLMGHSWKTDDCYLSLKTISDESGVSSRKIIRMTKKLEDLKVLTVLRINNKIDANVYVLNFERIIELGKEKLIKPKRKYIKQKKVVSASHKGSVPQSLGVVSASHQGSVPESHQVVYVKQSKEYNNTSIIVNDKVSGSVNNDKNRTFETDTNTTPVDSSKYKPSELILMGLGSKEVEEVI